MAFAPSTDELLARISLGSGPLPDGDMAAEPSKRIAVVACMDTRLDVYRILGLTIGEAHIIRNAGGVITDDVIRSLCLSQRSLGTREIILLHHTNCGLATTSEDQFFDALAADVGVRPEWSLQTFDDPVIDVAESIGRLRQSPFIVYSDHIRGFVYNVADGSLLEVAV